MRIGIEINGVLRDTLKKIQQEYEKWYLNENWKEMKFVDDEKAKKWVDSVYNSLNEEERIGQLIVTRLSTIDTKTKKITPLFEQTANLVKKYNIGSVCVFQGSPVSQAQDLNKLKLMAKLYFNTQLKVYQLKLRIN